MDALFWTALLEIIAVNIVLSGDNAVVIALACRSLPPSQQRMGILLGSGAAIVMRIAFTAVVATLMAVPTLKIVGGLLLFWIGWKLLTDEAGEGDVDSASHLWGAVKTVLIADAVMSLDNVIAVAAAAKGNTVLLILGLVISIPMVVFGATVLLKLIGRFPVIVTLGAALIGYIAGEVIVTDPLWEAWIDSHAHWMHYVAPPLGAILVVVAGYAFGHKPIPEAESTGAAIAAPAAVFGSRALLVGLAGLLAARAPWIVTLVATLLGYTGGQAMMGEQHVSGWADAHAPLLHTVGPIAAAVVAVAIVEVLARLLHRPKS
ncbi:MAG: TerC family protein [Alphaproteobacteria bacterium]|nr:TerC family protein [Alphaproteobacteria bacterium]